MRIKNTLRQLSSTRIKRALRLGLIGLGILILVCAVVKPIPVRFGTKQVFLAANLAEADSALADFQARHTFFDVQAKTITATDQTELHALYLTPHTKKENRLSRGLLVYFQGGGSTSWGRLNTIATSFQGRELDIVIFDYRGTGLNAGKPNPSKVLSDAQQWIDDSKKTLPAGTPVILYGVSVGSLFAPALAQRYHVDGLILDSAITSLEELVRGQVPWLARPFARILIDPELAQYTNLDTWQSVPPMSLLLVGSQDTLTPAQFSDAIQARLKQNSCSSVSVIPQGKHAELTDSPNTIVLLRDFVSRVLDGATCSSLK